MWVASWGGVGDGPGEVGRQESLGDSCHFWAEGLVYYLLRSQVPGMVLRGIQEELFSKVRVQDRLE